MTRTGVARRERDRGAVILEVALVAPLLFLFIFTMIDVGLIVLSDSVGTNAVRDGARVGIIKYENADVGDDVGETPSANYTAIEKAVNDRLVGLVQGNPAIKVRCRQAPSFSVVACTPGNITENRDVIEVQLTWRYLSTSPFVGASSATQRIRMTIVGDVVTAPTSVADASLSINDASVSEGDSGTKTLSFTITRTDNFKDVSVQYATASGSGSGGATSGVDFQPSAGTATLPAGGSTTHTVNVTINGDTAVENDETFTITLSNPTNAILGDADGTGTITNDDTSPAPTFSLCYHDSNTNGQIDVVRVVSSQALSSPGSWSVSGLPGGASSSSPTLSGSFTINIPLTNMPANSTGVTGISANGSNVQPQSGSAVDVSGGVDDCAGPIPVGIVVSDGDGVAEAGDVITFQFSEPVTMASLAAFVVEVNQNNGNNATSMVDFAPIASGPVNSGGQYREKNSGNGSLDATPSLSGSNLVLTINGIASGAGDFKQGQGQLSFSPGAGVTDGSGNSAVGSFTTASTFRLF